jgi:hypothetical protein
MEISSVNFIHLLDLNGTENAGVQSDGKTGDSLWGRDLGSKGRACEEIGSGRDVYEPIEM